MSMGTHATNYMGKPDYPLHQAAATEALAARHKAGVYHHGGAL